MNFQYIDLANQKDPIEGVVLRKLIIHKDPTGSLVETLRCDWTDVFDKKDLPFAMQYVSVTPSGIARDENVWHVHKHQTDRFICIDGKVVVAIYDHREKSKTYGKLNLFIMGPENENEMYLLIIPKEAFHSFMTISKNPAHLLNFPTRLYNPQDEGRVPNKEFKWNKVREDFSIK